LTGLAVLNVRLCGAGQQLRASIGRSVIRPSFRHEAVNGASAGRAGMNKDLC